MIARRHFLAGVGPALLLAAKSRTLDAQEANGRTATLISSNGKSVKLDEGTRVLLVVQEKKGEAAPQ